MHWTTLFPLFALLLGLCLGSIYNALAHWYLTERFVALPASHCPACGHVHSRLHAVPLLGYVLSGRRCRACGESMNPLYPLAEGVSGILALLLALKFGPSPAWGVYLFFTGLLITASLIDLHIYILPDMITLPGAALALGASWILPVQWQDALWGALVGAGFFLALQWGYKVLRKVDGMGTGDIKLMLMLGALTGWQGLFVLIFSAAVLGLAGALFYMARSRDGDGEGMRTMIPFGPFLAMGALVHILAGEQILRWWLG